MGLLSRRSRFKITAFFVAIVVIAFARKPIPDRHFFPLLNKSVKKKKKKCVILPSTKMYETRSLSRKKNLEPRLEKNGLCSGHCSCFS